jgi:hypothetical protein
MLFLLMAWLGWPLMAAPAPASHPFHVSVTEMTYNALDSTLEVSVKLFTDDLEAALEARYQQSLHLGLDDEDPDADVYLALYLREQLSVKAEGTDPLVQRFHGKQFEEDVTWCYLSLPMAQLPRTLYVHDALLTDQFQDQRNLVHLQLGPQRKSLMLHRGKLGESVFFE